MVNKSFSEVIMDKNFEDNHFWFVRFRSTKSYQQLSTMQKKMAFYVTHSFTGLSYQYENKLIQDWNVQSTKAVLLKYYPKKISATKEFFESIVPVLKRYINFLGVQKKLSNSKELVEFLDSFSEDEFINESDKKHVWDEHKQKGMLYMLGYIEDAKYDDIKLFEKQHNMNIPLNIILHKKPVPDNVILLTERRRNETTKQIMNKMKKNATN